MTAPGPPASTRMCSTFVTFHMRVHYFQETNKCLVHIVYTWNRNYSSQIHCPPTTPFSAMYILQRTSQPLAAPFPSKKKKRETRNRMLDMKWKGP